MVEVVVVVSGGVGVGDGGDGGCCCGCGCDGDDASPQIYQLVWVSLCLNISTGHY